MLQRIKPTVLCFWLLLAALAPLKSQVPSTVSAVLLADPHFDPFRAASKVPRLAAAPVTQWAAILAEPTAADDAAAFQSLQTACGERSVDAANDLLLSALDASAQRNADGSPVFVLLAGDLLVHKFDCRYEKLLGTASPASASGLAVFAQKTIAYVALELRTRFPQTAVYISLGNNDSGCGDYRLGENDPFLAGTGMAVAAGWLGAPDRDARKAHADYDRLGSYSLPLPSPMVKTRLVVVNDIYLSSNFRTCSGTADPLPGQHLLTWLDAELSAAERRGDSVWVLTHIPPGINTYSTNVQGIDVCSGKPPITFLGSTGLTGVLARHAAAIRVVVAGHTHVDEIEVFGGDEGSTAGGTVGKVAVKGVPSISTVSGNPPAYVTGSVDPRTGLLLDYRLHVASSATAGAPAAKLTWHTAYDFTTTYGEPAFSADAVANLVKRFAAGAPADEQAIAAYQNYFAGTGLRRLALQAVWGQYVCHMQHDDPKSYAACSCPAKP